MNTRQDISNVLDRAYAARAKQDTAAVMECFCSDGCFTMNGAGASASTSAERESVLQGMFATFQLLDFAEHCRVIDPPRAVVHWRGKFRASETGAVADADVLDLIEVRDGRIASLTTFFDTALAARIQSK